MSKIAPVEQAAQPLTTMQGVKRCFVFSKGEDNVRADSLPSVVVTAAKQLALSLLDSEHDRQIEHILDHVLVARRLGEVALCVVGDKTMVLNDVQRKLNVVAIRVQNAIASEPTNPIVPALREAYVDVAGPLSGLVFDRAFDDLRRTRGARDTSTLRAFIETLATGVTPPGNHKLLTKAEMILRNADTPSGSFVAAAFASAIATPGRSFTPPGVPQASPGAPTDPAPPPVRRPITVPRMTAVQELTRSYVGPLGDLVVQRALERVGGAPNDASTTERLIEEIASQLPEHKRPRFRAESKAAIEGTLHTPDAEPSSEALRAK